MYKYSLYQSSYIGIGEQGVKLCNMEVTIWDVAKNLYCGYFVTTEYLLYYLRVQYDHTTLDVSVKMEG